MPRGLRHLPGPSLVELTARNPFSPPPPSEPGLQEVIDRCRAVEFFRPLEIIAYSCQGDPRRRAPSRRVVQPNRRVGGAATGRGFRETRLRHALRDRAFPSALLARSRSRCLSRKGSGTRHRDRSGRRRGAKREGDDGPGRRGDALPRIRSRCRRRRRSHHIRFFTRRRGKHATS